MRETCASDQHAERPGPHSNFHLQRMLKLTLFYNVVEDTVPALLSQDFISKSRAQDMPKRFFLRTRIDWNLLNQMVDSSASTQTFMTSVSAGY